MDTLEIPVVEPGRQPSPPKRRWSPADRPPASGRLFVGLLGVAAILTTAALLLSDRAPGVLRSLFGDRARRLWERIDTGNRVELASGPDITQPDFMVHVALWSVYHGMGPRFRFVRAGTLDDPARCPPEVHIFTETRQPWVFLDRSVPVFEEYYDRAEIWPEESLRRFEAERRKAE